MSVVRAKVVSRWVALAIVLAACVLVVAPSRVLAQPGGSGGANSPATATSIRAALDRSRVAVGDSTFLYIIVEGAEADTTPVPPTAPGLEIRFTDAPRSTVSSLTIINGRQSSRTSVTVQYRYRVDVLRPGRHDIPPIAVTVGGRVTNTAPLTLIAAEPTENPDYFVELELSSQQAYVGEPVRLRATWYITTNINDMSFNLPGIDKLRLSEAPDPRPPGTSANDPSYRPLQYIGGLVFPIIADNVEHKGRRFTTVTLDRIVTAPAPGSYPLGPLRIAFDAATGSAGANLGLPFPRGQRMVVASNPVTLEVLPLPAAGKPPGFDGLVGDYQLAAAASPLTARAGDPIDLTWKITGSVTASTVPPMVLTSQRELADKFRVPVEPVVPRVQGRDAVFSAQVRPRPGATRIPPVALSVFDTKLKQYRVLKSEPIALNLLPGGMVSSDEPTDSEAQSTESTAIRPIPRWGAGVDRHELVGAGALTIALAPPALALMVAGVAAGRRRRSADAGVQTRIAARRALRALRRIEPTRADAADRAAAALDEFERRVRPYSLGQGLPDPALLGGVVTSIDRFDRRRFAGRPVAIDRRDLEQAAEAVRAVAASPGLAKAAANAGRLSLWIVLASLLAAPIAARAADEPSALDNIRSAESIVISDPQQARALASTALDQLGAMGEAASSRSAPFHQAMARAYRVTGDVGREQLALRRAARLAPWNTLSVTPDGDGETASRPTGELAAAQPTPLSWAGYVRAVDAPIRLWVLGIAWVALWAGVAARSCVAKGESAATVATGLMTCAAVASVLAGSSVALDLLQTAAQRDEVVFVKPVTARAGPDDVVFAAAGQPLAPGTLARLVSDGRTEPGWGRVRTTDEGEPLWVREGAVERVVP